MRNLKKVLSLTLALVMMLGMMTFAGAAEATKVTSKDMTDMDKVVNKEAVSLLIDLGILNGIKAADGTYTFNPAGNIERGAYAKMVYAVLMATDKADVYKGANTGLSDVKGHWAEGYIAYCVSTKIASGNPDKTFTPNANISVVAGAKMLLTGLGYDAKLSKYENDALWAINIMADAQTAGLMEGIELGANAMLTRDAAAQMIFNALNATKVTPIIDRDQGVAYLTDYKHSVKTLGETVYGLYSVTTTATGIDKDGVITLAHGAAGYARNTTDAANTAKLKGTVNMVGNSAIIYAKGAITVEANGSRTIEYKSLYSTSITATSAKVIGTSNDGTAWDDLTTEGKDGFIATVGTDATQTAYYYNGAAITASTATTITQAKALAANAGVIVTFLDTDNTTAYADVVKIVKKSVGEVTGAPVTKTDKDGNVTVKVPGIGVTSAYVKCEGYADLAKGDIVLYVNANGVVSFEKATSVEGKVTGMNSKDQVKVDGKYYGASGLVANPIAKWSDFDNTFTFYFDNSGSIVKAKQMTDETVGEHLFVIETKWKAGNGGLNGGNGSLEARILNTDGTSKIVTVTKRGGLTVTPASGDGSLANATHEKYDETNFNLKFFTFKTDKDGNYELTATTTKETDAKAEIVSGTAKFVKSADFVGNSATIFLVKSGTADAPVYNTYTGIAKVPAMTLKDGVKGQLVEKDSIVTHVYLDAVGGKIVGEAGEYVYVVNKDGKNTFTYEYMPKVGNVPAHYLVAGIMNGEAVTLKTDAKNTIASANVMYVVETKDGDGIISKVKAVTVGTDEGNVQTGVKLSGDTLVVGAETVTVSSATEVFYISKDGVSKIDYTAIENDKNDQALVAKKDAKFNAEIVYIIDVISTKATASKTPADCIATIGGVDVAGAKITGLTAWGSEAGTVAAPITATADVSVEIATADKDKAFTFTLKATDPEATVSLYSGTMPADGKAAAATPLVFQVVAEDGTTVLYYSIKLAITNA